MTPLVSIVITNYNYEKYLSIAIESALQQTYSPTEIIVVDDGSSDGSRDLLLRYEGRIISILKENGGLVSALNTGVEHSKGRIICFLDSDDFWLPSKVAEVVQFFLAQNIVKPALVHHLLEIDDRIDGTLTGRPMGNVHGSPCNLYHFARRYRFLPFETGPTSSISINRALADRLFPLPQTGFLMHGDEFIALAASLIGELYSLNLILGGYVVHGANSWFNSDQRKSPQLFKALDDYLNKKLLEDKLTPCISFYDSMFCWNQLAKERRWLFLFGHMGRLLVAKRDRRTLQFAYDTVRLIFNKHFRKYSFLRWIANSTKSLRHRKGL